VSRASGLILARTSRLVIIPYFYHTYTPTYLHTYLPTSDFNQSQGLFLNSNFMHFLLQRFSLAQLHLNSCSKASLDSYAAKCLKWDMERCHASGFILDGTSRLVYYFIVSSWLTKYFRSLFSFMRHMCYTETISLFNNCVKSIWQPKVLPTSLDAEITNHYSTTRHINTPIYDIV